MMITVLNDSFSRLIAFTVAVVISLTASSCSAMLPAMSGAPAASGTVSPYSYGLSKARTGIERYRVLLKTHQVAVATGRDVDYSGIKKIDIEIPADFVPIPLTRTNDFKGCEITVRNTSRKVWLFRSENPVKAISVSKKMIDGGDFRSVPALSSGRNLLIIEDSNPWVNKREGYEYPHIRKDILLIENGMAVNSAVMPYNNAQSSPKCTYVRLDGRPFTVKNLVLRRHASCKMVTYVFYVSGYDDVRFSNVSIYTPENRLNDDAAIRVYDCTNVTMSDVRVEGTYSLPDKSGYGYSLGNVWNYKAFRLYGKGNWGVFGNNNVNTAYMEDCDINRFDVHCYGRDLSFKNVRFFDIYNQMAGVYGTIRFDGCTFTDFAPLANGPSFNALVDYDLCFDNCVFNATKSMNYLMSITRLDDVVNPRKELSRKCLPNIYVKNLTVNLSKEVTSFMIFKIYNLKGKLPTLGYIKDIKLDGVTFNVPEGGRFDKFYIGGTQLKTASAVNNTFSNIVVVRKGPATRASTASGNVSVIPNMNVRNKVSSF